MIPFLLIACLFSVLIARASFALNGADVAIYNDSIAPSGTSVVWQDGVTAIKNMLNWMGLTYEDISYEDINGSNQDFSKLYKVLLFPGGFAQWYNYWISKSGKDRIRNFVNKGGGYFGICAGAFFACSRVVWKGQLYDDNAGYNAYGELTGYDLDLFPGTGIGPIDAIARWDYEGYEMTTFDFQNDNAILSSYKSIPYTEDILYYGGPYFSINAGGDVEALATYRHNGAPGIIAFQYGSGQVVLCAPHPEIEEDSSRDGVTIDRESQMDDNGSDWELVRHILNYISAGSAGTNYASEVLASDINLSFWPASWTNRIVGSPDNNLLSLGTGGYVIVKMTRPIINGTGNDLKVYECGTSLGGVNETYYVDGTSNCDNPIWIEIGSGSDVTSFDLSDTGLSTVQCIRLRDARTPSGKMTGADFDAVEGLNSSSSSEMMLKIAGTTVTISVDPVAGANRYTLVYASPDFCYTGEYDMGTATSVSFDLWNGAAFYVAVEANRHETGPGYFWGSNIFEYLR